MKSITVAWRVTLVALLLWSALFPAVLSDPRVVLAAQSPPTALPTPTGSSITALDATRALKNVKEVSAIVKDLRAGIDPTQLSLDDLGFALGVDAADLVDWVHSNIAFQQYPGLLRGAYGTLITRAGNTLDQALLLARLLGDAGYEVRIARAQIGKTDARRLLAQMAEHPTPAVSVDRTKATELLVRLGKVYGLSAADALRANQRPAAHHPNRGLLQHAE